MGMIFFIIYLLVILGLSFIHSRQHITEAGFLVNNRCSHASMVSSSIVASSVGASATMGIVGLAFKVGTPAFWWLGSGSIGLFILSFFLAKKVRSTQASTLSEIIENLLGKRATYFASIIIVVAWTAILAAQLTAAAMVITALTGITSFNALLISCVLITIHTLAGGQTSIIKLDQIQYVIILVGLIITLLGLIPESPMTLRDIKFEWINDDFPPSRLLYFLFILGGSYIVCPMLYGRVLSAKDAKTAKQGVFKAAIVLMLISAIMVGIGLFSQGIIAQDVPADRVLTTVLNTVFPGWLTAAIYVILLSAVISSADSCLLTASITLSQSVFKKGSVTSIRISIVALMIFALLATFSEKSILGFLLMANDIYVCSIVTPLFIYIALSKTKESIQTNVAISGMVLSGLLGLTASMTSNYYFAYAGVGLSALFSMLSLLPKSLRPTTRILEKE